VKKMADATPSQTIYLNNLTEKLSKDKLRRQLFNICSKSGPVLDVVVHRGPSMRGQAWVVFTSVEIATKALSKLNGYSFFQKPIKAQFARENASVVDKLEGKFVAKPKKRRTQDAAGDGDARPAAKRGKMAGEDGPTSTGGGHDSNNPPGPILKIDNLPEDTTKEKLMELFAKFEGLIDIRHVAVKGLAFIEYRSTEQAKLAREGLKGHQLTPTHRMLVNYAKPRDDTS
jgi:U2 small nuclear ribonucleoprotein B''